MDDADLSGDEPDAATDVGADVDIDADLEEADAPDAPEVDPSCAALLCPVPASWSCPSVSACDDLLAVEGGLVTSQATTEAQKQRDYRRPPLRRRGHPHLHQELAGPHHAAPRAGGAFPGGRHRRRHTGLR